MPNSNAATTTTNQAQGVPSANGINSAGQQVPINHQYQTTAGMDVPGYGSPSGRQQQFSSHFPQGFGFDPDIDNMFNDTGLRSHLDRMRDPFGTFGSRKRSGKKNPLHSVSSSHYDDDDADFPQFGSLGRRRAGGGAPSTGDTSHDDFFERLPSEFRHLIPDGFGIRRTGGSGAPESPRVHTQQPQYYQTYVQPGTTPPQNASVPQSPPTQTRTVCDAAIQTEDPTAAANNRSEVDGHLNPDNLNQHGLRNTVDMGVRAPAEGNGHDSRSHSAPPQHQNQEVPIQVQHQKPVYHSQGTGTQRKTPPPAQQQRQFPANQQPPQFQKAYYPPTNPQQQPAAPQTPGGTYIRTIPIFVEGRSEPLISTKEIPQQTENQSTQAHAQAKTQQHPQQQNRPTPINTQPQTPAQQQQQGPPPATPHTMDSINKIQDIQREVLNLMTEVEKFGGTRADKEYAFLDEMLTRNLLKLDTIDTQGKESIRLARKEAIKCIQASINVLEAKAEGNAKTAKQEAVIGDEATTNPEDADQPNDVSKVQEPIPLPPPESLKSTGSQENVPADEAPTNSDKKNDNPDEASSASNDNNSTTTNATTASVTKSGSNSSAKAATATETKTE